MTSRDPAASYYDLTLPDGTRTEVWSVLRAVLTEEEALGYVKACILTRIMRDGKKPDVDRLREVEKVAVEAGMLREAMAAHLATPDPMGAGLDAVDASAIFNAPAGMEDAPGNEVVEPITDDDAEDAARVDLERERNSLSAERRSWHDRNRALSAERQLDEARARIAELESIRDTVLAESRGLRAQHEAACRRIAELERERDEARADALNANRTCSDLFDLARKEMEALKERISVFRERAEKAERELAGVVDPEQLQRWRTALSASPTETLTNAICRVTSELAALRDRYRPRRQREDPAPAGVPVLSWNHADKKCGLGVWFWRMGENVPPDGIWTHQPPAPEAEREGEVKE